MTTTTTERAAQIVREMHQRGAVPYACPDRNGQWVLRVWGQERLPMQLLLEASVMKDVISAGIRKYAQQGWGP